MPAKLEILRNAGFTSDTETPIVMWIEPLRQMAFSEGVINDRGESWLIERLAERVPATEFWFYFKHLSRDPIKDCKEILSSLGKKAILPVVRSGTACAGLLRSI